jgi:soluble lytic murein transglycosylase-like protein
MSARIALVLLAVALDAHASRPQLEALADRAAERHGVPPALLKAVCQVESAWRARAIGDDGASIGLCQVQVPTALALVGRTWRARLADSERRAAMRRLLLQPEPNVDIAARLMRSYLERFEGDETLAVLAYNGGPGHLLIDYLRKVRRARARYE